MAKQTSTPAPLIQVKDLTAGVSLRSSPANIEPGQARRLMNTDISIPGELGVYPGWLAKTTSLATARAQGGKRVYLTGATFMLVGYNGDVFKPSDSFVWGSAVTTGLHATNQYDFPSDRNIVAVFDGSHVPVKSSDGTTWTQLGISAPGAPSLSAVAGGSMTSGDTFSVSYAYHNNTLNQTGSTGAAASQATGGGNLTVRAAVTASADPQVTHIKVYVKDVTAGESVRRLAATVANATVNVDITANTWDAQEEEPTNHGVAVAMKFGTVWKNRWWGADATLGNRLRFSEIFANMSWPATYYVDIPFDRGESITALIPFGDVLVVFGYSKFYLIIGQTSLDFEVRPALGSQTGAFGFRAADVVENGVIHACAPGVYLFNGAKDELLSYFIDPAWDLVVAASAAELAKTPLVYHKASKEVRISVGEVYPTSARGEWILNLNRSVSSGESSPAWFATDRTIGGYIQWDGEEATAGNQGRIFSWAYGTVQVCEERVGLTANGGNRTMLYSGQALPFGVQHARVHHTYLEYQPSSGTLTVNLRVDGNRMTAQSFSTGVDPALCGEAVLGSATYTLESASRKILPITWPREAEGVTAQFTLKYVGAGNFKAFTYGHDVAVEDVPRGR